MTFTDEHFLALFGNVQRDVYTAHLRRGKKRFYYGKKKDLTDKKLLQHIDNRKTAVVPSLNQKGVCFIGCIDIDSHTKEDEKFEGELLKAAQGDVRKVIHQFQLECGIQEEQLIVEYTGGFGYHIWFPVHMVMSYQMTKLLTKIYSKCFPDRVPEVRPNVKYSDPSDYSDNKIRLPQGYHMKYSQSDDKEAGRSYYVDSNFEEISDIDSRFEYIWANRVTLEWFDKRGYFFIVKEEGEEYEESSITESTDKPELIDIVEGAPETLDDMLRDPAFPPCFRSFYDDDVPLFGIGAWETISAITLHILARTGSKEAVHEYFNKQAKYTVGQTNKELRPLYNKWVSGRLSPHSCEKIQQQGGGLVTQYCETCLRKAASPYHIQEDIEKYGPKKVEEKKGRREEIDQVYDRNTGNIYEVDIEPVDIDEIEASVEYIGRLRNKEDGTKKTFFICEHNDTLETLSKTLEEKKINHMVLYGVKNLAPQRICQKGFDFLQHPELNSIPYGICKNCSKYRSWKELEKPVHEYIIEKDRDLYLNMENIEKIADEMETCPKCVAPVLLYVLKEEPIVILASEEKLRAHMFLDSGVFNNISSPLMAGGVILNLEFINQKIPTHHMRMNKIQEVAGLDVLNLSEIKRIGEEIQNRLDDRELSIKDIKLLAILQDIKQYLYLEELYNKGVLRKIKLDKDSNIISYSYIGKTEIQLNNQFPKECSSNLYAKTKELIEDRIIESEDGISRAPLTFRNVIENLIPAEELYLPSKDLIGDTKIYAIPPGDKRQKETFILPISNQIRSVLHARKGEGFYIGDGSIVSGRSQKKRGEVVIKNIQYHRGSERELIDYIDLNGGDFRSGAIQFNNDLQSRHLRYGMIGKPETIYIPWPKAFDLCDFKADMKYIVVVDEAKKERERIKNNERQQRFRDKKKLNQLEVTNK